MASRSYEEGRETAGSKKEDIDVQEQSGGDGLEHGG